MKLSDEILGKNAKHWWWLIIGSAIIFVGFMIFNIVFFVLIQSFAPSYVITEMQLAEFTSPFTLFLALMSLGFAHILIFIVIRFIHKRRYWSVIDPYNQGIRPFLLLTLFFFLGYFALGEALALLGIFPVVELQYVWDIPTWLLWIVPMTIAVFLQTSAEELAFRGFLQQYIARLLPYRWIYISFPAFVWTMLHYGNIDMPKSNLAALVQIFVLGLIFGDWADRTGSLVGPILVHFFNNFILMCFYGNSIEPDDMQIFRVNMDMLSDESIAMYTLAGAVIMVVAYLLIRPRLSVQNRGEPPHEVKVS